MITSEASQVIEILSRLVRERLEGEQGCHDWDHTCRVLCNARRICQACGGNDYVVTLAALLHDIARPEETASNGKVCHAALGAEMVPEYLEKAGEQRIEIVKAVQSCVRTHRYRKRTAEMPVTLEEKILFDADKLDGIGAIGIGRSFHFAGRLNARVHNTEREALGGESYGREDSAYREYLVKLRHVPERMMTEPGRNLAIERAQFMDEFFKQINRECF